MTRAQKEPTGYELWTTGLRALAAELGRPVVHSLSDQDARLLTMEGAQALLAHLRKLADEGTI